MNTTKKRCYVVYGNLSFALSHFVGFKVKHIGILVRHPDPGNNM